MQLLARKNVVCALILVVCVLGAPLFGLTQEKKSNAELDQFKGSTMGISFSASEKEKLVVRRVWSHLASELAGVKKDDVLLSIGEVDLATEPREKLREFCQANAPFQTFDLKIERAGEKKTLQITLDSKAVRDAFQTGQIIERNRIIQRESREKEKSDLLKGLTARLVKSTRSAKTPRVAYEAINAILDEFDVSHTGFVPQYELERLLNRKSGGIGLTIQRHVIDNRSAYFAIDFVPGSPSDQTKLELGNEILEINGVPIEKSSRLILAGEEQRHQMFSLRVEEDETVKIKHRKLASSEPIETEFSYSKEVSAIEGTRNSVRVIEKDGKKVGYIRLCNLMSSQAYRILSQAIEKEFADCSAVVLDLRGRGGMVQVVNGVERRIKKLEKPVVAITDGLTRSAKEMLSFKLKKLPNVTVIGTTTTGAVTGATFSQLSSGNGLMIPVQSKDSLANLTDGFIIEGKGVEPDEVVKYSHPYCGGKDALLEYAVKRATELKYLIEL